MLRKKCRTLFIKKFFCKIYNRDTSNIQFDIENPCDGSRLTVAIMIFKILNHI